MAKTIGTADFGEVKHQKCGKGIARVIDGVIHVECVRKGCREWVALPDWVERKELGQAIDLILSGQVEISQVLALADPLADYRQIDNLILIGPEEIEKAFLGPKGENPLGLSPGWCPRIPVPWSVEQIEALAKLCQTPDWKTTPIPWLALPEVAGQPTSLYSQYNWWGVSHDGLGPGKIRQDIMWSNWFARGKQDYPRAHEPAVKEPSWKIGYELPAWSASLNWKNQQKAAQERGLTIATAPSDALMLNLVAVATGKKLRRYTSARTATICDGSPLYVDFCEEGLTVDRDWLPGGADDDLGLVAEGVPKALGF